MVGLGRARVEMDRNAIARRRQLPRLPYDGVGVLVAQKDEGDFCHDGNERALSQMIVDDQPLGPTAQKAGLLAFSRHSSALIM
jgi:hypothetical protein